MLNIAILIPTTTKNTKFKNLDDTYLYKYCIPSLLNSLPNEHTYTIYYAIDNDDKIYHKLKTKQKLLNTKLLKNINKVKIISTKGIEKGNVVAMWNKLFEKAYDDENDFFIQMGDDIVFHHKDWLNMCIAQILNNINIGVSAPTDINNPRILTQSVVSRTHMDIFGYYFNPKITNWGCDDWISGVYDSQFLYRNNTTLENRGGKPRYDIINNRELWNELIVEDKKKLRDYINNKIK
tara:strand:+ start:20 stop:727 length:708 start_codon:yes stop_codon:yes gene_type:complete